MRDKVETYVRDWLSDERDYTIDKFGIDLDNKHIKEWNDSIGDLQSYWEQQFTNYLGRAATLGLNTPGGKQAFAKFVATTVGALEAVVRVYGEIPSPGVPSGENLTNLSPL